MGSVVGQLEWAGSNTLDGFNGRSDVVDADLVRWAQEDKSPPEASFGAGQIGPHQLLKDLGEVTLGDPGYLSQLLAGQGLIGMLSQTYRSTKGIFYRLAKHGSPEIAALVESWFTS